MNSTITLSYYRILGIIVIASAISAFLVNYVVDHKFQGQLQNEVQRVNALNDTTDVTQCRSGNLRTAYELANHSDGSYRYNLANDALIINNCTLSVAKGFPQPVSAEVQSEFVHILVHDRRQPIIGVEGTICGTLPLPSSFRGDPDAAEQYKKQSLALADKCHNTV